jgi:hypothetical protein
MLLDGMTALARAVDIGSAFGKRQFLPVSVGPFGIEQTASNPDLPLGLIPTAAVVANSKAGSEYQLPFFVRAHTGERYVSASDANTFRHEAIVLLCRQRFGAVLIAHCNKISFLNDPQ